MRIFAIGDTHLSRSGAKPMHVFGEHWRDHDVRIRANWNALATDQDVLLIAGDISWAMTLDEARPDFEFLAGLRGRKLLLRGNHDYWWGSLSRLRATAPPGIEFLQNDARIYEGVAVCGSRGWLLPDDPAASDADRRLFERELGRLRLSLEHLRGSAYSTLIVMTHYPPLRSLAQPSPVSELIESSGARVCVYGHLHGGDIARAAQGQHGGVAYKLVSADAVNFSAWLVWPPAGHGTCSRADGAAAAQQGRRA
jgi:predicted phosphohydrolase